MLRGILEKGSVRLALVLWCFAFVLVDVASAMQGRSLPTMMFASNIPMIALGVVMALAVASVFDRLGGRNAALKLAVLGCGVIVAGAVHTGLDFLWLRTLAYTVFPAWREWALNTDPSRVFTLYILYNWNYALTVALIWSARTSDVARLNEARAAAFEAAAHRAEAAALRLQLNPHFLFNTLNGIASLVVRRKSAQAEEMIGRLADFLRSSLAADPTALIPLRQELATVRAYLHIEDARFGERMRVSYDVEDAALDVPVPNFLLQPLIENAVKYGVARARRGADVEIAARRHGTMLHLSVSNSEFGVAPADADRSGNGIGLSNTRQRLHSLYRDAASVRISASPGSYRCDIVLPAEADTAAAA